MALGEKIDVDGLMTLIRDNDPDGPIQKKSDLEHYWKKYGLTVLTIDKKQWAAAI